MVNKLQKCILVLTGVFLVMPVDAGKLYVKVLMTAERVIFGVANYEILLSVCITILDTVT